MNRKAKIIIGSLYALVILTLTGLEFFVPGRRVDVDEILSIYDPKKDETEYRLYFRELPPYSELWGRLPIIWEGNIHSMKNIQINLPGKSSDHNPPQKGDLYEVTFLGRMKKVKNQNY